MRIGVFVCHCGSNIAGTVDVEKVSEAALEMPYVAYAAHLMYACSEPGQNDIQEAIKEHKLTNVIVASCSPRMHEVTFRRAVAKAGINPYLLEMANIREQCSWVHEDKEIATTKAIDLIRAMVAKVSLNEPLFASKFDVTRKALVIGGGIAGIQAALDLADADIETILLEKTSSIGGNMIKFDKTFPTLDCSACILTPKMVDVSLHEKIKLMAYSEIEEVSGYVGNFEVKIRKKATYVDWDKCTGCAVCMERCPGKAPDEFNEGIIEGRAINIPFPQAVPKKARIMKEYCRYFTKGKCGVCTKYCEANAINLEMQDEIITEKVGAIIVATGLSLFDWKQYSEYGGGRYEDVITSLQYERLLNASGPTEGHIKRPSDGNEPKTIVFVQCVGSRDDAKGQPYCSSVCCMYTAKHCILTRDHIPDSQSYVFYIDIRATGKGYEEFVARAQQEYGAHYIRGRVSQIYPKNGKLIVCGVDTLIGQQVKVEADLVVLAVGITAHAGATEVAKKLNISYDQYGFLIESHPKLRPVETNTAGIFLAGADQAPKDIPAAVAQASGAASKAMAILSKDQMEADPQVAMVNELICVGCFACLKACPYSAIEETETRDGRKVAHVIESVCQGCGVCAATCPSSAAQLKGLLDTHILAEVEAL